MGLTGLPVPVAGVRVIPFLAMKVGMYPGCFTGRIVLSDLVRLVEISLGVPPQGSEQRRQARRRLGFVDSGAELIDSHGRHSTLGI